MASYRQPTPLPTGVGHADGSLGSESSNSGGSRLLLEHIIGAVAGAVLLLAVGALWFYRRSKGSKLELPDQRTASAPVVAAEVELREVPPPSAPDAEAPEAEVLSWSKSTEAPLAEKAVPSGYGAECDISFRTNGGRAFDGADLPGPLLEYSTVGSMRSLVARFCDTRPESIRLVNRGVVLRDDSHTLRFAGVSPGDKLMVVVLEGATRFGAKQRPEN